MKDDGGYIIVQTTVKLAGNLVRIEAPVRRSAGQLGDASFWVGSIRVHPGDVPRRAQPELARHLTPDIERDMRAALIEAFEKLTAS